MRYYLQRNATFLQAAKHAAFQHTLQKNLTHNNYCNVMLNKLMN